ncbi:MAG: replication initiator, partial [Pseudonocardiaceae bacterium]
LQGKAHTAKHLGIGGRRVQVSRKWSGKTLDQHRAKRAAFVRELLTAAGIEPRIRENNSNIVWERTAPGGPDVPPRAHLLLQSISERQRWDAEMRAAQLHAEGRPPDHENNSATGDQQEPEEQR